MEMTQDERRNLRENFTASWLLDAVKEIDMLRSYFSDRDDRRPPEVREKLLRLHALAMDVIDGGWESRAREFFDLAADLDDEIFEAVESLERIQRTLSKLADLSPEGLFDEESATALA
jgi:hypothetical protein